MNTEIRSQVIYRLENYPELVRKRNILRYELEHQTGVSDDEVLEAMSFFKRESGIPCGNISDKTMYIALNYHDKAERLNSEARNELVKRLLPLERELEKLEYYVKLLPEREQYVISQKYFERKRQQEIAKLLEVSTWTVRKCHSDGIDRLVEMYGFADGDT